MFLACFCLDVCTYFHLYHTCERLCNFIHLCCSYVNQNSSVALCVSLNWISTDCLLQVLVSAAWERRELF